jgi:hypothetical protein
MKGYSRQERKVTPSSNESLHNNNIDNNNYNSNINKIKNEKNLTFRGQRARIYFSTPQVFSAGAWRDLDPKYEKELK